MVFAEFHRTPTPGGYLLLGVCVGNEHLPPAQRYGHQVSYQSYLLPLNRIAELLGHAGVVVTARWEQEPSERVRRQHRCLLARKPEQP
ncbi:hypothetical protein OG735_02250 [Streptomyces sp. NBC_01210]|uniref:hypothetical protein n=1 Tax=Streptomyces sp. NBC_01210 TaxID=2903774 RepID=UPI002E10300F|nr:hypothetical protein OG735_02250 [Streptomyces sp. NBC_01210]